MSIVLDGTGTISGLSAGGLPDATVTQSEIASGVAGTGPAVSAYPSSGQTLSGLTWTKLLYGLEEFDTNGNFASSRFTPTVAGYYFIQATMQCSASWTGGAVEIYKNGSFYKKSSETTSAAADTGTFSSSCLVYCNGSTDYVEAYGYIGIGQALTTAMWFEGFMVRAA